MSVTWPEMISERGGLFKKKNQNFIKIMEVLPQLELKYQNTSYLYI